MSKVTWKEEVQVYYLEMAEVPLVDGPFDTWTPFLSIFLCFILAMLSNLKDREEKKKC